MAIRAFSNVPRALATYTLTIPNVNTVTTAEVGVLASTVMAAGLGGPVRADMPILAHAAEALPTGIVFSGAYYKASDLKIYFQFGNVTASNYTGAATIDFNVVAF